MKAGTPHNSDKIETPRHAMNNQGSPDEQSAAASKPRYLGRRAIEPRTVPEYITSTARVATSEINQLTFGPLSAIGSASAVIFGIASFEASCQLIPKDASSSPAIKSTSSFSRIKFIVRYAVAQIVPSVIWGTQPAHVVAKHINFDSANLYSSLPPANLLRMNRYTALRGAVAGSVLLSQVLSLTNIFQQCRKRYSERIFAGKEPPLECTYDPMYSNKEPGDGTVIRLAGSESDVTNYSMGIMGRRALWPIFEDPANPTVKKLVKQHSVIGSSGMAEVPTFWQVNNGQYSQSGSWDGLEIPVSWMFETKENTSSSKNLRLIIEADATPGDGSTFLEEEIEHLDLDLREVGQAFHHLASLAFGGQDRWIPQCKEIDDSRILRVLLVDMDATMVTGSGKRLRVGDFVTELELADVTINARAAAVHSLVSWIKSKHATKKTVLFPRRKTVPILLETHSSEWFDCIRRELAKHGYDVLDRHEVSVEQAKNLPILVFERTSSDTVYRVRALVKAGLVAPENICALLQDHSGMEELKSLNMPKVSYLCPSQIYHNAFAFVRDQTVQGKSPAEIQKALNSGTLWDEFDEFNF